jgi:hypothetical protein
MTTKSETSRRWLKLSLKSIFIPMLAAAAFLSGMPT